MTRLARVDAQLLPALLAALLACALSFDPDPFTVTSGRYFTFTVNNFSAQATGRNDYGQLGIDSNINQKLSVSVVLPDGDSEVMDIAAGAFHAIFQTRSGRAYVTGRNHFGQLGLGNTIAVQKPALVTFAEEPDAEVVGVAAGYAHSLFLLDNGKVYAAGLNNVGQLGDGSKTNRNSPVMVNTPENAVGISAGYDFSYLLTSTSVYATGQNLGGQLGDGTRVSKTNPTPVTSLGDTVQKMSAGESHGLFLVAGGVVKGTGANFDGQLGIQESGADHKAEPTPIQVITSDVERVHTGGDSSCVIAGVMWNAYCMGSNRNGQLGFGTARSQPLPTEVPGLPIDVEDIGIGYSHTLFIAHPGDTFVSGTNSFGELGNSGTASTKEAEPNPFLKFDFMDTTKTTPPPTPAPPTPSPTPAPTPAAPSPSVSRDPNNDDDSGPSFNELLIWIVAVAIGVVALVINVAFQRQGARQMEGEEDTPNQNELELMRAEMDA